VPLTVPNLDDRRYQDLLDEALARIPVYTPEWTNFNKSDPGVTLVEIFAFLTENLLYRCNLVPDRNRKKFLTLLNIPLQPATSAQGLITISNDKGPLQAATLNAGMEVRSGQVPFFTARGIDVLPIEGRIYFKQAIAAPSQQVLDYYSQLYASFRGTPPQPAAQLYQAQSFPAPGGDPVSLGDTVDGYLWLALLVRAGDQPPAALADAARDAIASQTLSVGVAPSLPNSTAVLPPGRAVGSPSPITLQFDAPNLPASGGLLDSQNRVPQYLPLNTTPTTDVFSQPGVVDVTLPPKSGLYLWNNLDPLEAGVNQLPPSLDDSSLNDRLITWLRIRPSGPVSAQFLWMGINAVPVMQLQHVSGELLPPGTGEPDQSANLSQSPVLDGSVTVTVTTAQGAATVFHEVSDLFLAGAEVPVPDLRLPPGSPLPPPADPNVFLLDAEAGVVTFGDGAHGTRPPEQSILRADYDYSAGSAGNVGAGSINSSPVLQSFTVNNPLRTWGGADAETAADGEKQISRYLQHRDRLVTAYDFQTITLRTPGVQIGRVEVLPNFHPDLSSGSGGDAPGVITLMVIPEFDPVNPDAPSPSNDFLDTICGYLDTRRLITSEVFLRGPVYVGIWISIGVQVLPGVSAGPVHTAVRAQVLSFLAPTAGGVEALPDDPTTLFNVPQAADSNGWPLGKSVIALEIMAQAGRVSGVEYVQPVLLAQDGAAVAQVDIGGLQLPRVLGISITDGDPLSLDALQGNAAAPPTATTGAAQVPVIPQECT
jgi:hypothetical protein